MSVKVYSFKSKLELSEYLGISRPTLNSRLVKLNVKEDVKLEAPFTFTTIQLDNLKSDKRESKSSKKPTFSLDNSQTEPGSNDKIKLLEHELHDQQEKLIEIQNLRMDEYKEHGQTIVSLTNKMVKIQDQAQQLQLDLQQKLNQIDQEKIELLNQNRQLSASFNNSNKSQLKNDLIELQTQLTQEKSLTASLKVENDELQKQNDKLEADTAIHIQNLNNELNDLKNQAIANHDAMRKKEADYSSLAREKQELENKLIIVTNETQNKTFFEKLFGK
ncbi:hypothetical protein [Weissella viridescens]|uniref:hypothetical protein n=1 Tax=Weissella viridescens TaxID=1629 RepID=UPI003528880A